MLEPKGFLDKSDGVIWEKERSQGSLFDFWPEPHTDGLLSVELRVEISFWSVKDKMEDN